jgi:mRNA interferase HigB
MQVVHWGRAKKFIQHHPAAEIPLKQWKAAVQAAQWINFPDVRSTFRTVDWVDGRLVFNIKGNAYRLIAIAAFASGRIYIRHVLTHEEYDNEDWKR